MLLTRFDEIHHVNFARSGGSTRSFDIEVHSRGDMVYTFSSIEKEEYGRLYEFVKNKKIHVSFYSISYRVAVSETQNANDFLIRF